MKKRLLIGSAAALAVVLIVFGIVLSRQRLQRHRVFRLAPAEKAPAPAGIPPVEQWSDTFRRMPAKNLAALLTQIAQQQPNLYNQWSLQYLHARALLEDDQPAEAAEKLAPFLGAGNPMRDLALYHQAEIDDARNERALASKSRTTLIFEYPRGFYRDEAIDEETEYLAETDAKQLIAFATKLYPSADAKRRRDLAAHICEAQMKAGNTADALARGLAVLAGGTTDDPADRASRVIDQPALVAKMTPQQKALLGESMQSHRRFDRAVALLSAAVGGLPPRRDDLTFAIGRSAFGDEKFEEARATYLRGAASTVDPKWKATFLFHASRASQLLGDDKAGEQLLTQTIAVPGRFPATTAAITQRIRTRLHQKRVVEAATDLQLLRKTAPNDHALVEGSIAYALGLIAGGNPTGALSVLNSIPPKLLDPYDRAEVAYWRARALEGRDPRAAFAAYLTVLRADAPTHFAYFTRERLDAPAMKPHLAQELATRDAQIAALVHTKNFAAARPLATDRVLLAPTKEALQQLESIYKELPPYRAVLELTPLSFPAFPSVDAKDRPALLMAMGLFDEAADDVPRRYGLRPMRDGLTQSLALNRGNASRESIYAIEVLTNGLPTDYVPELLPQSVRQLLYPRYFYDAIEEDSAKYKADPTLVLSIMREESRFNPRAKSEAAARGLLQFIITTARSIGRDVGLVDVSPEDLYDPRVIIRLGAKYIATLTTTFDGNRYKAAAAYNAGPKQTALWSRLSPAPGDDFFLSSVNFDETKHYVRKVMNSYRRYDELYGRAGVQGGLRAEP
ncbi:MAG: lytic transglycosylase domain-containing protein [Acidobacteria bacterium]|nr:lytic transglycosylase domain-containing protein [Acidobacteriota bacterium]